MSDQELFSVLDTESTGFKFHEGHRLIEIGIVEMKGSIPTGRTFHVYVDPQRDVPEDAYAIHKLSRDDCIQLGGGKLFSDIALDMLEFIGTSTIVAHNASHDVNFLDAELKNAGLKTLTKLGNPVIDTLTLARAKYGPGRYSLDNLNARLLGDAKIKREAHGALLDATILAEIFKVMRISQTGMTFDTRARLAGPTLSPERLSIPAGSLKVATLREDDQERHQKLCERIKKSSGGSCLASGLEFR
ncbi:exonuclease domain-containing protein (plasmid) [Pseudomonas silesiensis]|uniref:exonuclease domain-containing protein n=1 Tax=Pseudomonas silesiensis TaxID=1853130 RepID=UPI0030D14E8F